MNGSIPVAQTRITLKNVPAERATFYSDETFDALSTRLVAFIHMHMPVREVADGHVTQRQVNRADVVTIESVNLSEAPPSGGFRRVTVSETQFSTLTKALDYLELHGDPEWAADIASATAALCSGEPVR